MNLIKVGETYINMDQCTRVEKDAIDDKPALLIHFEAGHSIGLVDPDEIGVVIEFIKENRRKVMS